VPRIRWYQFLHRLKPYQLDVGARMLQAGDISDIDEAGMQFLNHCREYHDVLLLNKNAPWSSYQTTMRRLHQLGIINLSLTLVGRKRLPVEQLLKEKEQVRTTPHHTTSHPTTPHHTGPCTKRAQDA